MTAAGIGRGEQLSYAAGDLGFNFVWQSIELYLLFYYVDGLHLSPVVASAIFLAGAVLDWVSDPLIGAVADRAAPGVPLRLWVAIGGPAAAIVLALCFAPLPFTGAALVAVALASHLTLRLAYSLGNIPYAALTARISDAARDHLALTGVRMQGAALGGLIAAGVYAALGGLHDEQRMWIGAQLLALLSLPAFLATFFGVRERIQPPPVARMGAAAMLAAMARLLHRSPGLRRLLATIVAAGLSVTVTISALLFLFQRLGAEALGYRMALLPSVTLLVTTPLWTHLARRIGRVRTLLVAGALHAAALAAMVVLPGVPALIALLALALSAGNGMSVMFWALVPVAIAEIERDPGSAGSAGRVYALGTIARKLGQALAPLIVSAGLGVPGAGLIAALALTALAALGVMLVYRPRGGNPPLAPR